ncbi:hypothetical protein KNP414_05553 [Paenibacillus mucilaginosus KNP414]|uniref:Uncharacterized protein n=1 Tax=Paenibacillus mucilaginosus (strain KNP414) TaxID=1036673 RepID=F8FK36_PAEMK|nr:hypothetical protein KNP414_05553 [Paenibacillus mucilaginosus KNP414]
MQPTVRHHVSAARLSARLNTAANELGRAPQGAGRALVPVQWRMGIPKQLSWLLF